MALNDFSISKPIVPKAAWVAAVNGMRKGFGLTEEINAMVRLATVET